MPGPSNMPRSDWPSRFCRRVVEVAGLCGELVWGLADLGDHRVGRLGEQPGEVGEGGLLGPAGDRGFDRGVEDGFLGGGEVAAQHGGEQVVHGVGPAHGGLGRRARGGPPARGRGG